MSPRVVDAHTHIFPPDFVATRQRLADDDPWFGHLYENPAAALATDRDLLESMDHAGVDFSIICGFPWSDPGLCHEHNAWMDEICRLHPDRLAYLAIVRPGDRSAARDAERWLTSGAAGIGELNADAQNFDLCLPDSVSDLMEVCRTLTKPVMLHASEPLGHAYPGKGTATPDRLAVWLSTYPNQPVVLAHWGGGLPFYELMPEVRDVTQNVTYDSAATSYLYRSDVFAAVAGLVGPDRVMFGTDYPVLSQFRLIQRVFKKLADDSRLHAIMSSTAERVYGVERDES